MRCLRQKTLATDTPSRDLGPAVVAPRRSEKSSCAPLTDKQTNLVSLKKVTLQLQSEDLASIRFAVSPLRECLGAFRAWADPARRAMLPPWMAQAQTGQAVIDWEVLRSLVCVPQRAIPDFLLPPPPTASPELSDELGNLRRTPESVVLADMAVTHPRAMPLCLQQALTAPRLFLAKITTLIEEFWKCFIAPRWSVLRSKLESELLFRGRMLALEGADGLFRGLHRHVTYQQRCLTIQTENCWEGMQRQRGLLLVPSIFCWPDLSLTVHRLGQITLTYASRGIANLWVDTNHLNPNGLALLLGGSCAKVLAYLHVPRTTVETSADLALSPSASSEQITKLWRAGLLERTRVGRLVFYALNKKGKAVSDAFHT